jgi:hypothetical protein
MLAKIGHSFAAAELGLDKFKPAHLALITAGQPASMSMIGGAGGYPDQSMALHELELGYQRVKGKNYVVAKVCLFAAQCAPRYLIVGESLEDPIARFRRVFFNRIRSAFAG